MTNMNDLNRFDYELSKLFTNVDLPDSNDKEMQTLLCDYHLGTSVEKFGKGKRDQAIKKLKQLFAAKIDKPTDSVVELMLARPFKLGVKVDNPRKTFDKDAFISILANKYEISQLELIRLAETCVKKSAAPVSFITSLVSDPEEGE